MSLQPPVLSLADPAATGEGSIDPLSLQATYERLAERIFPFMTVRMQRPRFLTAIAAGARVCDGMEDDLAVDGITPAWLVYEWYVVEALVRRRGRHGDRGDFAIPGSAKVARALRTGRALGKDAYLKTPKVFGFTGFYKTLAIGLQVMTDELLLDDGGFELLGVWEREQELPGFMDGRVGKGAELRDELRRAVRAGMERGYTRRRGSWEVWDAIVDHLHPSAAGRRERDWLSRRLRATGLRSSRDPLAAEMRRELFERLEAGGRMVLSAAQETRFFRAALAGKGRGSIELQERLSQIDAYEGLVWRLESVFQLVLHLSARTGAPASEDEFAREDLARHLASELPKAVGRVEGAFAGTGAASEIDRLAERYSGVESVRQLFRTVLEHHYDSQRDKPPDGKRPWVEDMGAKGVLVRPQYGRSEPPSGEDAYAHDYRTSTATQFLQELGRLPR